MCTLQWTCLIAASVSVDSTQQPLSPYTTGGACRPAVIAAMLGCPRDAFVPEGQRDEDAFVDAPLAMEGMGFNMSAPHMHATCLEALQLQPGHRSATPPPDFPSRKSSLCPHCALPSALTDKSMPLVHAQSLFLLTACSRMTWDACCPVNMKPSTREGPCG